MTPNNGYEFLDSNHTGGGGGGGGTQLFFS